jgi:hypothetical protein
MKEAVTLWGKEAADMENSTELILDEVYLDARSRSRQLYYETMRAQDMLAERKKRQEGRELAALHAYDAVRQEANKEAWLERNPGKTPGQHNLRGGGTASAVALALVTVFMAFVPR